MASMNFTAAILQALIAVGAITAAVLLFPRWFRRTFGQSEIMVEPACYFDFTQPISRPTANPDTFNRHLFFYQTTAFVGRETMFHTLQKFTDDGKTENLRWWLICGVGGVGKSRLVYEYCKKICSDNNTRNWKAVFVDLKKTPLETWTHWLPQQPTLLVIDNVARFVGRSENDFASALKTLTERSLAGAFRHRIRILLLERNYQDHATPDKSRRFLNWYLAILRESSCGTTLYREPFVLPTIDDRWLLAMAAKLMGRVPVPGTFIDDLANLDSHKRPLFAIYLAEYLRSFSQLPEDRSRATVLNFVIQHELEHYWKPAGLSSTEEWTALLKATVTGKLVSLRVEPEKGQQFQNGGLGRQVNPDDRIFWIHNVQPDLLGEYLVLEGGGLNEEGHPHLNNEELKNMILDAWDLSPEGTFDFFNHCRQDFWDHPNFFTLFETPPKSKAAQIGWALTAVTIISQQESTEKAQLWYEKIKALDYPEELRMACSLAAFNLGCLYLQSDKIDSAVILFEEMKMFSDSEAVKTECAMMAYYLFCSYNKAEKLDLAEQFFEEMRNYAYSGVFKALCAQSAAALMHSYIKNGKTNRAEKLFDIIKTLGETDAIREYRAQAARMLVQYFCKSGNTERAETLYKELKNYGSTSVLRTQVAYAAYDLVCTYGVSSRLDRVDELLLEVRDMGHSEPILEIQAKILLNLIAHYCHLTRMRQAEALFEELQQLGDSDAIQIQKARATFHLINTFEHAGQLEQAEKLFAGMMKMKHIPAIDIEKVHAAVILISAYRYAEKSDRELQLFGNLRSHGIEPADLVIEEMLHTQDFEGINLTAAILVQSYCEAGLPKPAERLFAAMKRLSQLDASRIQCARAAVSLITWYSKNEQLPRAEKLYNEMRHAAHSGAINLECARAATLLVYGNAEAKNFDRAEAIYEELKQLGTSTTFQGMIALAASGLIARLLEANQIDRAEHLCEDMKRLNRSDSINELRAKTAVNLTCAYCHNGKPEEAEKIFAKMQPLGTSTTFNKLRAIAAGNVIEGFLNSACPNKTERAAQVFKTLELLGDNAEIQQIRKECAERLEEAVM